VYNVDKLKWGVAGPSPRKPKSDPGPANVMYVVEVVIMIIFYEFISCLFSVSFDQYPTRIPILTLL